jgi:hypothetical protein
VSCNCNGAAFFLEAGMPTMQVVLLPSFLGSESKKILKFPVGIMIFKM